MSVELEFKIQRLKRCFIAGAIWLKSACLFHSSTAAAGQNVTENSKTVQITGQCSAALSELIAQSSSRITLGQWTKHCNVSNGCRKSMNYHEAILGAQIIVVSSPQAISPLRKVTLAGGPVNATEFRKVDMDWTSGPSNSQECSFYPRFSAVPRSGMCNL